MVGSNGIYYRLVMSILGHYFEQAKPAFFDDIKQLLIGPLFLIAELYFACGFENELADKIHQTAIAYRKKMTK